MDAKGVLVLITKRERKEQIIQDIKSNISRLYGRTIDTASKPQIYVAVCHAVRDELMEKWTYDKQLELEQKPKRLYYLSVEFLQGRALGTNLLNLDEMELYAETLEELGVSLSELEDMEPDPGLGNGGLGRLASCFLESLATLNYRAIGCGIRFEYGLFRQKIIDGSQFEIPDAWLDECGGSYPFEVVMRDDACDVRFGGTVTEEWSESGLVVNHTGYSTVQAIPYDIPIAGYQTDNVGRLRLWRAVAAKRLDMDSISSGNYARATEERELAEVISKVLYPNESHREGKSLRLKQHYFLTSATVQYIISDYKRRFGHDLRKMEEKVCIQINDTHPSLAIPELMRILIDEEGKGWDEAWSIVTGVFNYTNHTVMSEALERWPEELFKELLPRIYMIVKAINDKYCEKLWSYYPGQWERIGQMAIVGYNQIRMANLCIAASAHVNGVSQLHADILRQDIFRDFFIVEPWKFIGITNGITPRRWLMYANPKLAALADKAIGQGWRRDLNELSRLMDFRDDAAFVEEFAAIKRDNKARFADWLAQKQGAIVDPDTIFDVQAKRLHEYKRQLLNALHILYLYDRLMTDPSFDMQPTTFLFGAKASAAYSIAKSIIRLINVIARKIDEAPPRIKEKLKVVFLENYNVTTAEMLIPACDVSEQISTAGKEASGTGNMKFMLNGALTIGTLDGANVEISQAVGPDNIYIFGLTADQTAEIYKERSYSAGQLYGTQSELRHLLDYLISGALNEPDRDNVFSDIYQTLLFGENGDLADNYLVLPDFAAYRDTQARINQDYGDQAAWTKMAIANTAMSGIFSSDRTIEDYNKRIWHLDKLRI